MTLHIEDEGQGEPVVLAHAGVTDRRIWDAAVPVLVAAGYRAIRYDLPGYGLSPRPTQPSSLVALALEVLAATGVESAHWIGLSQGAATGVDLALAQPERIRSLVLVAPGMSGYDWPPLPGTEARQAAWERGDAHGVAVEMLRLWGPLSFDGSGQLRGEDPAAHVLLDQADWFMQDEEETEEPAAEPRLGEIGVPTLIVLGDRDVEAITDIGHRYEQGIPGARLVTVSPADHLLPLRVPDQLHPLLLAHLANSTRRSPRILEISWGRMEVEGLGEGKDFKLYPGGGREWDWAETGTRHAPGIQPADVEELLTYGVTDVVLSQGMDLKLGIDPRTLQLLADRSITLHVAETNEAVEIYNELAGHTAVGGLFHSTC